VDRLERGDRDLVLTVPVLRAQPGCAPEETLETDSVPFGEALSDRPQVESHAE
jgi:hypothetical protein